MQPTLCSRCKKNVAVIFITRIENGESHNEGLCLRCARELHIKPVDEMMEKLGISDADLDNLTGDVAEMLGSMGMLGGDGAADADADASDADTDEDDGKTATFPFLNRLFNQNPPPAQDAAAAASELPHADGTAADKRGAAPRKLKFLNNYCIDLTQRARDGKLDAMVGRAEELERVIQILNRRQKNNPCLIGEPGVGKTAIAEGLAQRIAEGNVPYKLRDKQVYLLDLTALVAGTQFRGQFESRMKGLIEEIRRVGNIILVIDEVHNIVGAGDAEGSMNAANILKPALSRGEIQVIGATTFAEYRKHIEKDAALERRFQPVTVAEPSIDDSVEILKGVRRYYEDFHGVVIPDDMCRLAVVLSERYITDRFLPDKAIDLIDEACSDVNLKNPDLIRADEVEKEIGDYARERELLASAPPKTGDEYDEQELDRRYERIAELRSREMQLQTELDALRAKGRPELTADNLARIIELWTKIPAASIRADEFEQLAGLGDRLRAHIVGQDQAIDTVCAAIRRNRVGLQAKRKPVSFLFVGGTGVGKTELVKRLADELFHAPESLIRLDMSEYMEKFSVSRMIGSPPGYVGYDEAGQLTEKIRRRPYSVVLFDEIEKAHPDVMNLLLQILDDGRITDAQGRTVNFENTVIIMTTNAGSNTRTGALGFGLSTDDQGRERAQRALNEFLRPEFLNRIDEIVYFNHLTEENFRAIAALMLDEVRAAMAERGMTLHWTPAVIDYLVRKGYSETYGARNLRRTIQRDVEDAIASAIVARRKAAGDIGIDAQAENTEDGEQGQNAFLPPIRSLHLRQKQLCKEQQQEEGHHGGDLHQIVDLVRVTHDENKVGGKGKTGKGQQQRESFPKGFPKIAQNQQTAQQRKTGKAQIVAPDHPVGEQVGAGVGFFRKQEQVNGQLGPLQQFQNGDTAHVGQSFIADQSLAAQCRGDLYGKQVYQDHDNAGPAVPYDCFPKVCKGPGGALGNIPDKVHQQQAQKYRDIGLIRGRSEHHKKDA